MARETFLAGVENRRRPRTSLPPLSCRTSPPQGGRSARRSLVTSFSIVERCETSPRNDLPLEGEMSGRTEAV
ncbi:hypothetical protein CFBP7129_09650 [Agrobacterium tumefaciens]|uniref:Propionyl-coenzyme A carboxylase alpha polypeptide n=1 Tax=Agrobacterium tumefaciens TaxID=358 RepID=A0A4D7YT88_AGRTU|nr:hypothetical protein CFBP7129_09650 [Agrobacterium tumefaciens]